MPIRHEVYDYSELYPPVLARASNLRSPRSVELDPDYVSTREGAYRNQKILRPGYMAGTIPGSTMYRPLPRTLTTAAATTATPFSLTVKDSSVFVVGDVVSVMLPQVQVNVTSSTTGWVAGDLLVITIDGVDAATVTVESADIGGSLAATNNNLRNKLVAALNAGPLAYRIKAIATSVASYLVINSLDPAWEPGITLTETGANGGLAATTSTLEKIAIGAVTAVDADANTLTFANSGDLFDTGAATLPAGLAIGVASSNPFDANGKVLGMISPSTVVDLLYAPSTYHGLFTELSVYADRLPYWDAELQRLYPAITLV